jgi:hypothetical protein
MSRMAWVLATAMVFVAAVAPVVVHHPQRPPVAKVKVSTHADAAISDEALLAGVQNDLSTSVPASMLPLAGTSPSTSDSADSTAAQRNNP